MGCWRWSQNHNFAQSKFYPTAVSVNVKPTTRFSFWIPLFPLDEKRAGWLRPVSKRVSDKSDKGSKEPEFFSHTALFYLMVGSNYATCKLVLWAHPGWMNIFVKVLFWYGSNYFSNLVPNYHFKDGKKLNGTNNDFFFFLLLTNNNWSVAISMFQILTHCICFL